jgi:hypothetical protein
MMKKLSLLPSLKSYTTGITDELLTKIQVITGWRLPKDEKTLNILCIQLQKKLRFDYPGITHDEIENAFLKFGSEENFTGSMSIAIIDRVLKKYFASVAGEKFDAERKETAQVIPMISPQQHLNECRELIEHKYMLFLEGRLNVELLPAFIFPVLIKDFNVPPDMPEYFTAAAKEFIRDSRGKNKFRKSQAIAIGEAMGGIITDDSLQDLAVKLSIERCFQELQKMNYQHLYAYVS